ncbi:MAG: hypothetical protein ACHQVS_00550 [Candidatus Babeliales bacterium]
MAYDRFIIAPFDTGLQTDVRPWLVPDDAFVSLKNAYVFRGRVRKRFGSLYTGNGAQNVYTAQLFSRLAVLLGTTSGAGVLAGNVPGNVFGIGQAFSVGTEMFTVYQTGNPANMLTTGASTVYTYDTTTGAYVIHGAAHNTPVYFYPATPVMGLTQYETGAINAHPAYAFDTQFAYVYTGSFWEQSQGAATPTWQGSNSNFFWVANWRGISTAITNMFVTNFNATVPVPAGTDDPVYTFDGTTWSNFSAVMIFNTAGDFVQTALMIVPFKDRLVLLNTIEQKADNSANTQYKNRARFCHNGSPFATNAWLEPNTSFGGANADGAGWLDAVTEEAITSCEFIKDRLIVYFERSTWELAYTGNQVLPFVWQKINTELGSEATFSSIPFDKVILTMGTTGVHACNGSNVERIDNKIPDQVFDINDINMGVQRVAGIRDYFTELVYWTFPSNQDTTVFPNQILVYNYKTGSWALNDDVITAWGYFDQQQTDTWVDSVFTWENADMTWQSSNIEAQVRQIIAGNQEGYIFIISPDYADNAPVMQINNMTVSGAYVNLSITNHTLSANDFITIQFPQGITYVPPAIPNIVITKINKVIDANTVKVGPLNFTGIYTGGGTVSRVSNINILSKQWNPYVDQGRNVYIAKIDFGVLNTGGQVTVDYYTSSSNLSEVTEGTNTGAILGTSVLETGPYTLVPVPLEFYQQRLWHPIYFQSDGEFIQINLYWSDAQMLNGECFFDFQLEGLVLHSIPVSQRLQ